MKRFPAAAVSVLQTAAAFFLLGACAVGQFPAQPSPSEAPTTVADDGSERVGIWQSGAAMPTARSEMRVAVVDGIFYVPGGFGGLTSFEAYDPASDSWTELAPMPEPAHHMMVTGHDGKVYVFGGGPDLSWQATASDPGLRSGDRRVDGVRY